MNEYLSYEEEMGLTVLGPNIAFQVRGFPNAGGEEALALIVHEDATRSSEDGHPVLITQEEAYKLREVLNEAMVRFDTDA